MMALKCVLVLLIVSGFSVLNVTPKVISLGNVVLFTNNDGGGDGEVQVPNGKNTSVVFCTDRPVKQGWYTPMRQIKSLFVINLVDVTPQGNCVKLTVGGYDETTPNGRVHIHLHADV